MAYKVRDISGFEEVLDWPLSDDKDTALAATGEEKEKKNYTVLFIVLGVFLVLCGVILYFYGGPMFTSLKAAKWFTFITMWFSIYSYANGRS